MEESGQVEESGVSALVKAICVCVDDFSPRTEPNTTSCSFQQSSAGIDARLHGHLSRSRLSRSVFNLMKRKRAIGSVTNLLTRFHCAFAVSVVPRNSASTDSVEGLIQQRLSSTAISKLRVGQRPLVQVPFENCTLLSLLLTQLRLAVSSRRIVTLKCGRAV